VLLVGLGSSSTSAQSQSVQSNQQLAGQPNQGGAEQNQKIISDFVNLSQSAQNAQHGVGTVWTDAGNLWYGDGRTWYWHHDGPNSFAGMNLAGPNKALRAHLKLPNDQGVLVMSVRPNSPAALVGIQPHDVLLKLSESPLDKPEDFEKCLKAAGDKPIALSLIRGGKTLTIHVQPQVQVTLGLARSESPSHEYWIGVSATPLDPSLRAQLRIPNDRGLLIAEVMKDGPAEKAGIKPHDILLKFGGKLLSDQSKLVSEIQAKGEKPVLLSLMREGKEIPDIEVTPKRRASQNFLVTVKQPEQWFRYDVTHPAFVLQEPLNYNFEIANQLSEPLLAAQLAQGDTSKQKQAQDATAALSKRIDELDAEISKLRKALDEFGKAAKAMEELKKAAEELRKAAEKK
jgi:membrane-associated protease RseP (regulator of RpoE activity)